MKFNKIFSSNTVFANGKPIRVYGEGDGEATIEFAGKSNIVTAIDGKWYTEFAPMPCGGPYSLKLTTGNDDITFDNVWVGEVYLCAGQSNIELRLTETNTPLEMYKSNDMLRCFEVDKITKNRLFTPDDGWVCADKETVYNWTAIGYLAGMEISEKKNVAVGIINCNQGASVIESWVPAGAFEKIGINIPREKKAIGHTYPDYQRWNTDGALYEHQFRQVFPFSVNGVIWYQGEADSFGEEASVYCIELQELIRIWRENFDDSCLPFYVIQIADYRPENDPSRDFEGWARVQEAQERIQALTNNVVTVISRDVCETDNIHPPTKNLLAKRVAETIIKNS